MTAPLDNESRFLIPMSGLTAGKFDRFIQVKSFTEKVGSNEEILDKN
jgi:hypothetical protein